MKVTIDKTFPMPAPPEVSWATLRDIEAVASCMPGAKITERVDERHYRGTVTVKVGPAMLAFKGEVEVQDVDVANRTLHLVAKGTDTSGSSAASLDLTARVQDAEGGRSDLVGHSEASVSGKAATFGGRMMDAVSEQILKQFAANFAARVEAQSASGPGGGATTTQVTATEAAPVSASATPIAGEATVTTSRMMPAARMPEPEPLNGLALAWAVFKSWLRGLFAKKTA